jgi:hypothetical protein
VGCVKQLRSAPQMERRWKVLAVTAVAVFMVAVLAPA